ncbi:MAG: histidine kinase [Spirochaetaceae bacterium]|nr:histidine kinase [Spirochaetaceae bacterium]
MLRRFRYIYKLFLAFLLTGVIPVILLSTAFTFLSSGIMRGSYRQQSQVAVKGISDELNTLLEKYRHTVYLLSEDEEIIAAVLKNEPPLRPELLRLYKKIYTTLSGHIDDASIHIISLTDFPSFSSQQVPQSYYSADDDAANGLFTLSRSQPEKTMAIFNNCVNSRGDSVMMTLCRAIRDENDIIIGFIVLEINKQPIAAISEKKSQKILSHILIVDPENNLGNDLIHNENDGNFSPFPFLSRIPAGDPGFFIENGRMVIYHPLSLTPFQITGIVPLNIILSNLAYLVRITLWLLLLCILLAVLLAVLVSRSISGPVHHRTLAMGRVEAGDLSVRISQKRQDEIGFLYRRFNIMTGRIENLMIETLEEQQQLRVAERKALQAQINPHFLYNTLNTIKSIAKLEGVDQITSIVTQLGKLLRNTIDDEKEMVSLKDSLDLVESYLSIQKIRFGERLNYEISAPEELREQQIPKLILQPLVENAVIHGLE